MSSDKQLLKQATSWADETHKQMLAATLLNPSLITFRSMATDEPEIFVYRKLLAELCQPYKPKQLPELLVSN